MAIAFVTGGTGFLGSHLIKKMADQGWQIRALHRLPDDAARLRAIGAEPVQGDLAATAALRLGLRDADAVFHSAALFKMWGPYSKFELANVEGTRNLLAAAAAARVKRFVQIGASGAYMGERRPLRDLTEDAPLACPTWGPYIASKARSQMLVQRADTPGGMRTSVILPSLIWGPEMTMLDDLVASVKAGQFAWPDGGKQIMSTSHVDNVCRCAMLAAELAPGGHAYFVTDGAALPLRQIITDLVATQGVEAEGRNVPVSLAWQLAKLMEAAWKIFRLKKEPPLSRQQLRMMSNDFTMSDRRAREELGYMPTVTWAEGIAQMQDATGSRAIAA